MDDKALRPEKGRDVVECIQTALIDLMEHTDFDKISVVDVTRQAHVSRSTFYRHYNSVREVADDVEDRILSPLREINRLGTISRLTSESADLSATSLARYELFHKYRRELLALTGEHGDALFVAETRKLMHDYFKSKVGPMCKLSEFQIELYIEFVTDGNFGFVRYWLSQKPDMPPEEAARLLNRLFYTIFVTD